MRRLLPCRRPLHYLCIRRGLRTRAPRRKEGRAGPILLTLPMDRCDDRKKNIVSCLFLNCFFSWWENDVVACRLLSTNVMSISVIYETVWLLIKECGFGYTHTPIQETPTPRTKTFSVWANVCFVLFIADRPADFDRPFWIFTRNEGYNWGAVYISSPSSGGHLSTSLAKRDKSLTLLRLLDK